MGKGRNAVHTVGGAQRMAAKDTVREGGPCFHLGAAGHRRTGGRGARARAGQGGVEGGTRGKKGSSEEWGDIAMSVDRGRR